MARPPPGLAYHDQPFRIPATAVAGVSSTPRQTRASDTVAGPCRRSLDGTGAARPLASTRKSTVMTLAEAR